MFNTNKIEEIRETIEVLVEEINDENLQSSKAIKDIGFKLETLMKYLELEFAYEKSIATSKKIGINNSKLCYKDVDVVKKTLIVKKIIKNKKNK